MGSNLRLDWDAEIQNIDGLIRAGKATEARSVLRKLAQKKVPRGLALKMATLARRVDEPRLGLRILNPIVRPSHKEVSSATDDEKVEYAFCLTNSGAYQEALPLLKNVDPARSPQALLSQSFAYIVQWNYAETIPLLRKYTVSPLITDYQRIVGLTNLVQALVWERDEKETEPLIDSLLKESKEKGHTLVHGKVLMYKANHAIGLKQWDRAGKNLQEAEDYLKATGGTDEILIQKWRAAYRLYREGGSRGAVAELRAVRIKAAHAGQWETVRHCDYFESVVCKNAELAQYLYFGTPYPSFRDRLTSDFGVGLEIPRRYEWKLGAGRGKATPLKWLVEEDHPSPGNPKLGQSLHRALLTLASDFYRPLRVTSLHHGIYPDLFFNPTNSPNKIHQILKRVRIVLRKSGLPLCIDEKSGEYRLGATSPILLEVPLPGERKDRDAYLLETLNIRFGVTPFSSREAMRELGTAYSTTVKLLLFATQKGILIQTGRSVSVRYRFTAQIENSRSAFRSAA